MCLFLPLSRLFASGLSGPTLHEMDHRSFQLFLCKSVFVTCWLLWMTFNFSALVTPKVTAFIVCLKFSAGFLFLFVVCYLFFNNLAPLYFSNLISLSFPNFLLTDENTELLPKLVSLSWYLAFLVISKSQLAFSFFRSLCLLTFMFSKWRWGRVVQSRIGQFIFLIFTFPLCPF